MSQKEPSFAKVHSAIIESFDLPVYEFYEYHSEGHHITVILQGESLDRTFSFRQQYDAPDGLRYTLEGTGLFKISGATWGPDRVTRLTPTSKLPGHLWCLTFKPVRYPTAVMQCSTEN